jgi:histone H3/H4
MSENNINYVGNMVNKIRKLKGDEIAIQKVLIVMDMIIKKVIKKAYTNAKKDKRDYIIENDIPYDSPEEHKQYSSVKSSKDAFKKYILEVGNQLTGGKGVGYTQDAIDKLANIYTYDVEHRDAAFFNKKIPSNEEKTIEKMLVDVYKNEYTFKPQPISLIK